MHAGDRDAILQSHEFGKHLCTLNHGNVPLARCDYFRISFCDRRAGDHNFSTGDIFGAMSFKGDRSEIRETVGNAGALQIRSRDLETKGEQHFSDAAHANATDTDKMYSLDLGEHS